MRKTLAAPIYLTLISIVVASGFVAGCSGDSTTVIEGDGVARRKSKDAAMEKMLYPEGKPAPSTKKIRGRGH